MDFRFRLLQKRQSCFIVFFSFFISFPLYEVSEVIATDPAQTVSLRGLAIDIGGELALEFVDSESDNRLLFDKNEDAIEQEPNSFPKMSIDKIVITRLIYLKTGILFKADFQVKTDGKIKLDEAWVKIPGLPFHSWLKIGLDDLFMKPDRKTESYPILGHAFWQDEDLGIFLGGKMKEFYWRFSVTNGRRLKDRRISEDEVFPISTDDDDNDEKNHNKQVGFGVGIEHTFEEGHKIDLLPFYYQSSLSDSDFAYLQGITTYETGNLQSRQQRVGLNLDYRLRDFAFFGQYIRGKDGAMDRDGWYVQPSYKTHLEYNRLTALVFLIRYGEYNVNLTRNPADSRTWDRRNTTLAVIASVVKGLRSKQSTLSRVKKRVARMSKIMSYWFKLK